MHASPAVTPAPAGSATRPVTESSTQVVMPWLVRLRWAAVFALAAAAWAAQTFWRVRLPVPALVALLAALAATNAALAFQLRSPAPHRGVVAAVLVVDVFLLAGLLYLVGGPINPFSIVLLVGVTIAGVSLGYRWAIALAVLSNLAYGVTFAYHRPLEFIDPDYGGRVLTLHLSGMWVAFAAATLLIAYFVGRVSDALGQRERELAAARAAAARSDRLAALFALGAGAAHELATPLSTISTAVGELERVLQRGTGTADTPYLGIIRGEVERCTRVLDQLSGRATATAAGAASGVALASLVDDLRYRIGESLAARLDVTMEDGTRPLPLPAEPLRQALVALVRNAFDASGAQQRVALHVARRADGLQVAVVDHGRGMDEAETARAVEPFYTTKPPGAGLGLGLFLVQAFADQLGGTLRLASTPGAGTTVTLHLPVRA
ncbi:MAG: sensor histidine kinase [Vicinamibacterales bacterium]